MFAAFRARVTRAYVLLAIALILLIFGSTTVLAFALYARSADDSVQATAQRVAGIAAQDLQPGVTLQEAAPQILAALGRSRFHIAIIDRAGRLIAQNEREPRGDAGRPLLAAFAQALGLPRAKVAVNGGAILIAPDFDRFGQALTWYWAIALPIGALAILVAWYAGRRITSRAVGPLVQVTRALQNIAAGDFSPQPLTQRGGDVPELTDAYNQVAFSLAAATAERERTHAQMRQFIADAGHELRTPLTIVMGYLDALRQGMVQSPEATQRTYDTMLAESRRMRTLIEKLILLARLERAVPPPPANVEITELARRAATALEPLADGRIKLSADGEHLIVRANEDELYEAIKNAMDNALKYAPGSDVSVAVSRENGNACVLVADSGPGMEEQDAAHAFDRFYRGAARADVEGSGLGLAIAKIAVERAGGTVTLDTAPGAGTRLRFCLPLVA